MPYCTLSLLAARYGEQLLVMLTDRGPVQAGAVDTAVLDRAIADADAVIDGYLAGRYVLPLAAIPPLIAGLSQVLTLWNLHVSTPEGKVKADYDAAMAQLRDIARGTIRLPDAAGIEPAGSGSDGVLVVDRERPFTEATMKGFI